MVEWLAYDVGYLLIVITAITATDAAWRHGEKHRRDILLLVGKVVFANFRNAVGLGRFSIAVILAEPYALLRLVRDFRKVPAAVLYGALAIAALGTILYATSPRPTQAGLESAVKLYVVVAFAYAALAFTREVGRSSGVTARRLASAAAGARGFSVIFVPSLF